MTRRFGLVWFAFQAPGPVAILSITCSAAYRIWRSLRSRRRRDGHVGVGVTPGAPYVPCPCLWLCRLESFPQIT